MSNHIVERSASDDGNYTGSAASFMKFSMQLVNHSQWKSRRTFNCGSTVEVPISSIVALKSKVNKDLLDFDIIGYDNYQYYVAAPRSVTFSDDYIYPIVRIYSDDEDLHCGYVRLIKETDNTELLMSDLHVLDDDEKIHGPAVLKDFRRIILKKSLSLSDAATDIVECQRLEILSIDAVYAVHCPNWPEVATEWITRRRAHGFPSKSVLQRIVRHGCDFVQVSHKLSTGIEWRYSFSKAELEISKSWSMTQRIAYCTLWLLNKLMFGRSLCSYYFKTLMLWACEEKPVQFWRTDNLLYSVVELLIIMVQCVKLKFCANYFIPGNNMMDHLIDADMSYAVYSLWKTCQKYQIILLALDICEEEELRSVNTIQRIDSPSWINRGFLVYHRVDCEEDTYRDLFCTDLKADLKNALYTELSDVYRGLCFHRKSACCVHVAEKRMYFLKSESYLLLASGLCESQEKSVIDNCSDMFCRLWNLYFMMRDPDASDAVGSDPGVLSDSTLLSTRNIFRDPDVLCDVHDALGEGGDTNYKLNTTRQCSSDRHCPLKHQNKYKSLLYNRAAEVHENETSSNYFGRMFGQESNVNISIYSVAQLTTHADVLVLKDWRGQSPTVNISWFITNAYLANLYYTAQRDVSLTFKTCDDVIDTFHQSKMNRDFSESAFPVILSSEWACIYNKEIQEQLGFFSLCSFVLNKSSSRSAYLGVCPVQFCLYIKLRAAISYDLGRIVVQKFLRDYLAHLDLCQLDRRIFNGTLAMTRALHK